MMILPCGDGAVLIDCATAEEARNWGALLAEQWTVTLGATTVLVHATSNQVRAALAAMKDTAVPGARSPHGTEHVIPVAYDGPDLENAARHTGLTIDTVITAHTSQEWTVGFGGFSPGFAYLVDGDPRLQTPRLDIPRPRVRAGSVGLAGSYSGIYPRDSAGGWLIIGHTEHLLWNLDRDPPALLQPGDRVRFEVR